MSDEDFDERLERLEEQTNRYVRHVTEGMEDVLATTPTHTSVPMPGEMHPAYSDKPFLMDWLSERGPYADRHEVFLPKPMPPLWSTMTDEPYPTAPMPQPVVLQRRRCAGPAPYIGRPFCYEWWAVVDDYGRGIGGESRIVYREATP